MQRAAFVAFVSLSIACATGAEHASAIDRGRCASAARIAHDVEVEHKFDEEAFERALSGRGLTTVVAKMHVWPLGYGGAAPTGTFEDRDDAGTTVHVLMMGTAAQQCGPPLPQDLARDASGTLHVITRLASPIRHRTVIACECPPSTAACGGMAAPPVAIGYELPAGTVYGGAVSIAYDIDDSEVRYPSRCQQALQVP